MHHFMTLLLYVGVDVFTCKQYYVSVRRTILPSAITDFTLASSVMFATHFVFNAVYNPACVATLEFMQR